MTLPHSNSRHYLAKWVAHPESDWDIGELEEVFETLKEMKKYLRTQINQAHEARLIKQSEALK